MKNVCGLLILVVAVVVGLVSPVSAEDVRTLTTRDDAAWLCDMFMIRLTELDAREAFALLRPYSAVPEEDFTALREQADGLLNGVGPQYGALKGYTLLQQKSVKDVVVRFTYLLRFEKHALRWMFYFYKADKEWAFSEFKVDNKLHELF